MSPRSCRLGAALLLVVTAFAFAGCDQLWKKSAKDDLAAGDRKVASGDFRGAVAAYEDALDGTVKTADAHFKLALLYEGKLASPLDVIHHVDRYLALEPKGTHAKDARSMRNQAEQKMVLNQGKGTTITQQQAVDLKNENLKLRELLAQERSRKAAAPVPADKRNEIAQKPIPPGSRTHVVQPGETMASIALKYYKSRARWKDIQDANFYATGGTPKIKPGQTLIVPQ